MNKIINICIYITIIRIIFAFWFARAKMFWNFVCEDNCEWHIAWYNWAEEKSILNEQSCVTAWKNQDSNSFMQWYLK